MNKETSNYGPPCVGQLRPLVPTLDVRLATCGHLLCTHSHCVIALRLVLLVFIGLHGAIFCPTISQVSVSHMHRSFEFRKFSGPRLFVELLPSEMNASGKLVIKRVRLYSCFDGRLCGAVAVQ